MKKRKADPLISERIFKPRARQKKEISANRQIA